ncbi:MAG: hypothetical protein WB987_07745, partial [Candidatus Acidiferrales bacterium]
SSIEVPEFVSLTDDTSNDFTLAVSAQTAASVRADETAARDLSAARTIEDQSERSVQVSFESAPAPSPAGYRHLLCIYRT